MIIFISFNIQRNLRFLILGHNIIAYVLIKNGANVNETDNFGKTALHWSSEKGNKA